MVIGADFIELNIHKEFFQTLKSAKEQVKNKILGATKSIDYITLAKVAGATAGVFSVVGATVLLGKGFSPTQTEPNPLVPYSDKFGILSSNPSLYGALAEKKSYHNLGEQIEEERRLDYLNGAQVDLFQAPRVDFFQSPQVDHLHSFKNSTAAAISSSFHFPVSLILTLPAFVAIGLLHNKISKKDVKNLQLEEAKELYQKFANKLELEITKLNKVFEKSFNEMKDYKETKSFRLQDKVVECLKIKELLLLCFFQKTIVERFLENSSSEKESLFIQESRKIEKDLRKLLEKRQRTLFEEILEEKRVLSEEGKEIPEEINIILMGDYENLVDHEIICISESVENLTKLTSSFKGCLEYQEKNAEFKKLVTGFRMVIENKEPCLSRKLWEISGGSKIKGFASDGEKELDDQVVKLERKLEEVNKSLKKAHSEIKALQNKTHRETKKFSQINKVKFSKIDKVLECLKIQQLFVLSFCRDKLAKLLINDENIISSLERERKMFETALQGRKEELFNELRAKITSGREYDQILLLLDNASKHIKIQNGNVICISESYEDLTILTNSVKECLVQEPDRSSQDLSELKEKIERKDEQIFLKIYKEVRKSFRL